MFRQTALAVAFAVAQVTSAAAPRQTGSRPNIVFIMSDDLGYGEVGARNGEFGKNNTITTPNIDALFASGMSFPAAYAGEAVCAPSRGSLLTGYHTGHAYIRGNFPSDGHDLPLRPQDFTLSQLLQQNGYQTVGVGKWGLGWWNSTGSPWAKGFDYWYGNLDQSYCHNMYPSAPKFTFDNTTMVGFPANANASREYCMFPASKCIWAHDLFTNKTLDVLDGYAADKDNTQPLFLYIAYTDVSGIQVVWFCHVLCLPRARYIYR